MKIGNSRQSNLFCTLLSTRFILRKYSDMVGKITEEESKGDAEMNDSEVPVDIKPHNSERSSSY